MKRTEQLSDQLDVEGETLLMEAVERGRADMQENRVVPWEGVKSGLQQIIDDARKRG